MNLTQTAQYTRRAVAATVFLIILLTVGRVGWQAAYAVYRHFVPPKETPPETRFGKIPLPEITGLEIAKDGLEYVLDTPSGALPRIPSQLPVFPMERIPGTPLKDQEAQKLAESLGLSGPPQVLTPSNFQWSIGSRTLAMNIVSQNFTVSSNRYTLEPKLILGSAPAADKAQTAALNYIQRLGLADKLLESSEKTSFFVRINEGNYQRVESLSEAQLTRVDFFKTLTINETSYRILGPKPREGLIHLLVAKSERGSTDEFPEVRYQSWKVIEDSGSTYPLRKITTAWEQLTKGEATPVYLKPQGASSYDEVAVPQPKKIRIQKISLAYYENEQPQEYLTPILTFEGLAETSGGELWEIVSYLPAVEGSWLETSAGPKE